MNLAELRDAKWPCLSIHDSRYLTLIKETRPPYSVILNIVGDGSFEIYCHDERGYCVSVQRYFSEEEACEAAEKHAAEAAAMLDW